MKRSLSANRLIFLLSLYICLIFNIGFWHTVWQSSDSTLLWAMPLFIISAMTIIIQLLFWPKLHRLIVPLLLICGAGASYAVMVQGIYFDADMLQNLLQTDMHEASAWLSWRFICWIALTGILPTVLYTVFIDIRRNIWWKDLLWRVAGFLVPLAIIGLLAFTSYSHFAAFFRNNHKITHQIVPTNLLAAGIKSAYNAYDASRPFESIATDAERTAPKRAKKQLLILVVGETTRAQNWGLNANAPDTTPKLKLLAQQGNLINYPNMSSCGTATAVSVPCLFSVMPRENYQANRARHQENVLDILQHVGVYASWRNNNGGCKGVCDRIPTKDVEQLKTDKQCPGEQCYDTVLLNHLDEEIRQMKGDGVIVLHTIGSHGPTYYQRYPAGMRRFTPTCDTNQIQDCSSQELQNTYNNTIVAVDDFLNQTITLLQQQTHVDGALLYFSDHGESLGEKGIYLHGTPYAIAPKEQTHIPMIFWAQPSWYQSNHISPTCMKQHADKAYSHDNLFHTLLGTFGVRTKVYQPSLDLFAPCRTTTG